MECKRNTKKNLYGYVFFSSLLKRMNKKFKLHYEHFHIYIYIYIYIFFFLTWIELRKKNNYFLYSTYMTFVHFHLFVCMSICLSVYLSVCLPVCLSTCLSVCASICRLISGRCNFAQDSFIFCQTTKLIIQRSTTKTFKDIWTNEFHEFTKIEPECHCYCYIT